MYLHLLECFNVFNLKLPPTFTASASGGNWTLGTADTVRPIEDNSEFSIRINVKLEKLSIYWINFWLNEFIYQKRIYLPLQYFYFFWDLSFKWANKLTQFIKQWIWTKICMPNPAIRQIFLEFCSYLKWAWLIMATATTLWLDKVKVPLANKICSAGQGHE